MRVLEMGPKLVLVGAMMLGMTGAVGAAPAKGDSGLYLTGSATQTANHWPFTVDLFRISHYVKDLPAKSREAMVDSMSDKRFVLKMLRDVDCSKLKDGLGEGYERNEFTDENRVNRFLRPLDCDEIAKGSTVEVVYDAAAKTTTLAIKGGASASLPGVEFMKATWRIWFGDSRPRDLGDELIGNM